MTRTVPPLSPAFRRPLERASVFDLAWAARWHQLDAYTGQVASVSSFGTANNLIGSDGATLSVLLGMPPWQMYDVEAGIVGRETATLKLESPDRLGWDRDPGTGDVSILLEFIQQSSFPAAGKVLLYVGNDAISGGRLQIESSGTQYRVRYHNGTTSVTSTLSGTAPTNGQFVRLRATRAANGSVQIFQSIDFAAETSATASGTLGVTAFGATCRARLNGDGAGNNTTTFNPTKAIVHAELLTLAELVDRY